MNTPMRNLLAAALVITGGACQDIDAENLPPTAVAEVLIGGKAVELKMPIPYEGTDIELTLSGKKSSDEDGVIAKYEWRRTDVPASVRFGEDDAGEPLYEGDPKPAAQVEVVHGEGSYRYTLFVTDEDGAVSAPASVAFTIETIVEYEGDPACLDAYEGVSEACEACVCAQAEMDGCLDLFDNCFNNADAMFSDLCVAVFECGTANVCSGAGCYTPDKCMAEIDAASQYMGGDIGKCSDAMTAPEDNPCRAVSVLSSCISLEKVAAPERAGCGKSCAM